MPENLVREFSEHSRDMVRKLRLPSPKEVPGTISWPSTLGDLSEELLSRHLTYWSGLVGYAGYKVSILSGAAMIAQMEFEQEFDVRYTSSTDPLVTDKRHHVGASKAVRAKKRKACQLQADLKVLQSLLSSYEMKYAAVSRELTRRKNERFTTD